MKISHAVAVVMKALAVFIHSKQLTQTFILVTRETETKKLNIWSSWKLDYTLIFAICCMIIQIQYFTWIYHIEKYISQANHVYNNLYLRIMYERTRMKTIRWQHVTLCISSTFLLHISDMAHHIHGLKVFIENSDVLIFAYFAMMFMFIACVYTDILIKRSSELYGENNY